MAPPAEIKKSAKLVYEADETEEEVVFRITILKKIRFVSNLQQCSRDQPLSPERVSQFR